MSLLALPHELVHESVPPNASKSEQIELVKHWKQDQIVAQFGVNPRQFWAGKHHHCFQCNSLLKMTIMHNAPGREEVYRIKIILDKLYNPRWRAERPRFFEDKTHVFYYYLTAAYSAPHYGCSGMFERVDILQSPQPTELQKECEQCHLKARARVPNKCRVCDRDYGVLPCSCGEAVCVNCLQHDYRQEHIAPLCHICLRFTCTKCTSPCTTSGCKKRLCVHCKDVPHEQSLCFPPVKVEEKPAKAVKKTVEEESDVDVDFDGLFD